MEEQYLGTVYKEAARRVVFRYNVQSGGVHVL